MDWKALINLYKTLLIRLGFVLIMFIICRVAFYLFNKSYFDEAGFTDILLMFLGGIRFDISAILIINLPFIALYILPLRAKYNLYYRKLTKYIFILINTTAILANCIDYVYFRFTLKRTTADLFSLLGLGSDFYNLLPQFIKDYWYVIFIWFWLTVFLFLLYEGYCYDTYKGIFNFKYYSINTLISLIIICLIIIGIRGGVQLKPLSIISASQYATLKAMPLVLNTPFTIIKTINKPSLSKVEFFKDSTEVNKLYTPIHQGNKKGLLKKNIIIIILESFSKEHIGYYNPDPTGDGFSLTPFLDSLMRQSLVCKNAYSNSRKSIEALPAIISGIPSLMDNPYITSAYSSNDIMSLAKALKTQGYYSAFFHGGTNGTMGFDNFVKLAGFDDYFGRQEYNNDKDYDGKWGIFDEPFLQYTASKINSFRQPFLISVFTLSSHHPYKIPAIYSKRFNKGNEIENSISYTDYSLKRFFNKIAKEQWFKNSLFVLTADHTSDIVNEGYKNYHGMYAIPIIFYEPSKSLQGTDETICQQIDIMPSLLDYINYPKPYFAFGNSLFNQKKNKFAISFFNDNYLFFIDDYLIVFDGTGCRELYNYNKDLLIKHNLIKSHYEIIKKYENYIKAIIQTYNNSILHNQTSIKN
ncbi:MAG: sulfatase-like hydrolase/transferase [Bacteroidales bacterium]|nr:sulfatase-like hydrolase/transferase [Bacteroidales bacterium]